MDDVWGDAIGAFVGFLARYKWTLAVAVVVVLLIAAIVYNQSKVEDACRDKGGIPIASEEGVACVDRIIK